MANIDDIAKLQPFDASSYRVGMVVGLFNGHITEPMKELALKTLVSDYGVTAEHIYVVEVAGAADMPAVLEALAGKDKIDCLISIAAIIRGETAHFDFVARIITDAVREIQVKHAKPVAFGVLTVNTQEQAKARVIDAKGYTAAALHAARSIKELG
ncbi:MAG: 6,7-dimethyl-8-ribityllumazine synthase [Candidatus Azotimanducaceae bacterium]|jgi:6,7-dimethyl-8-ribityllumazine synthase